MKKLLLILALLAYVAISCEDKPTNLTDGDEPGIEQPGTNPADTSSNPGEPSEPEDTIAHNADTCQIRVLSSIGFMATFFYNVSSEEVDFEASINSIFKHFTITLKDGTTPAWIGTNCTFEGPYSSDTGSIDGTRYFFCLDSLPYGNYIAISWDFVRNHSWGPNYYNPELQCLYHDIVLDEQHTAETIEIDKFKHLFTSAPFLSFTRY